MAVWKETVVFTELIWNCKAESPARQANYEFLNLNLMQVRRLFIY